MNCDFRKATILVMLTRFTGIKPTTMPKFQQEFLIEVKVRRERLKETLMQHFAKESKTQDHI